MYVSLVFFIIGACMFSCAIYERGRGRRFEGMLTVGVITLLITGVSIKKQIEQDSRRETMRILINEPVNCKDQLYGYKITARRIIEGFSEESSKNVIDVKSNIITIPYIRGGYILENILVDPNFCKQLTVDQSFPPEEDPNSS